MFGQSGELQAAVTSKLQPVGVNMTLVYALLAAVLVSAASLVGIMTFLSDERLHKRWSHCLLALAAGAMLGNGILHLIPHALTLEAQWAEMQEAAQPPADPDADDHAGHSHDHAHHNHAHHDHAGTTAAKETHDHHGHGHSGLFVAFMLIVGLLGFHFVDLMLKRLAGNSTDAVRPEGYLVLVSDAIENMMDGLVIGTAFMISVPAGIAATITIFLHEIPLELGDFAVLRHSGFSRTKALLANLASGLVSVVGVLLAFGLSSAITGFPLYATPIAAGAFIYIACCILIPHVRKEAAENNGAIGYFFMTSLGVGLMALILLLE